MAKTQGAKNMTIKFTPNDKGNPPGKLADAELHFSGGPLDGLKLIGFAVWERRNGGRTVTFPHGSTRSTANVGASRCCDRSLTPPRRNGCAISFSRLQGDSTRATAPRA
jgi:hypothetical protein